MFRVNVRSFRRRWGGISISLHGSTIPLQRRYFGPWRSGKLHRLRRAMRSRYWMLVQFAGAGASMRRLALAGSKGTSWTAMDVAATEPSFRMMCTCS